MKRTAVIMTLVFAAGVLIGATKPYARPAATCEARVDDDMTYRGDLVMTVAVGLNGTAVLVDIRLAASEGLREIEFSHDTASAAGIQGLPRTSGVYECIVEEWTSDVRREFRVRDYWSVST